MLFLYQLRDTRTSSRSLQRISPYMRTSFADIDKGGWYGQSWTETIFVLDLSVLDPADGMVTATEEKVFTLGCAEAGGKD